MVLVAAGAEGAVANADRLDDLRADAAAGVAAGAEEAAAVVRQAWREAEEFNLNATLLLEALFVRLRRVFGATERQSDSEAEPLGLAPVFEIAPDTRPGPPAAARARPPDACP